MNENNTPKPTPPANLARPDMLEKPTVILGAGPAGLTAGYLLARRGLPVVVLEAENQVGGIAKTAVRDGYRFDLGGHRFFTKVKEVDDLWHEIMREDFLKRPRMSRIYWNGRFLDYPLRAGDVMRQLGPVELPRVMASYARAAVRRKGGEASFEDWVVRRFGRIDALVNAAGVASQGNITSAPTSEWQRVLDINLTGSMLTSKYALVPMLAQRSGSIVNVGSIFGEQGCDNNTAYNVSKGGISQLTRSLAIDYGHANIRVNGLCPGLIDTPMTQMVKEQEAFHAFFASQHMLCRAGRPEEVANVALFLASDDASFVSGQMIGVDGGFSAGRRFAPPQA